MNINDRLFFATPSAVIVSAFTVFATGCAQSDGNRGGRAGTAGDLPDRVDEVFADYSGGDGPGCSVGVIQDGRLIGSAGYGMANLDHGIPQRPDDGIPHRLRLQTVHGRRHRAARASRRRGPRRSRPALHPPISRLRRSANGPPSGPSHVGGAGLHRAHVPGREPGRGLLHQRGSPRDHQPPAGAQLRPRRQVPVQQRRVLSARRDRRPRLGHLPPGLLTGASLRPPGDVPHALPRRSQRGRRQPGDRLCADGRRLRNQRDHAGHGR